MSKATSPPVVSQRVHHTVSPSRGTANPSNEPSQPIATQLALVQPATLQLALLDPQVAREVAIAAAYLLDEALGIFTSDEHLDGVAERVIGDERRSMIA